MAKLTKTEKVLSTIKRGPARGLTAEEVAARTDFNLATVRSYIYGLQAQGSLVVCGKVESGKRGRPALRYTVA